MTEIQNSKQYNLEDRTYSFAKDCRALIRLLSRSISNIEDSKQLIRASGSVAANYIEANESLSKKDFILRIKICRKEAKESTLWLRLCDITDNQELQIKQGGLLKEAIELMKIFSSIITKIT